MTTLTQVENPPVVETMLKSGDKTSVFHQLRDFRSQVPKNMLKIWEEPAGYAAFL